MRIVLALLVVGCSCGYGTRAPRTAAPAEIAGSQEIRCYAGVWRTLSMSGDSATTVLLRRTVAPASSAITEEWHFAGHPDDLVHELAVEDAEYTGVTRGDHSARTAYGRLVGAAWAWDRWDLHGESESGWRWDLEYTRTTGAIEIFGTTGAHGTDVPDTLEIKLETFACVDWDSRRAENARREIGYVAAARKKPTNLRLTAVAWIRTELG